MGIGIIVTTLILMISFSQYKSDISDAEIIKRAEALGMVMKEDKLFGNQNKDKGNTIETELSTEKIKETELQTEISSTETLPESEVGTDTENITNSDSVTSSENVEDTREKYQLEIFAGNMPRQICTLLEEQGVIENGEALRLYLQEVGIAKVIPVGKYEIPYGATNEEIHQIIKAGPIAR